MSRLLSIFFVLFLSSSAQSQSFVEAYRKHSLLRIDSILSLGLEKKEILNKKEAKKLKQKRMAALNFHLIELDTIFDSHKRRKGFDFNSADTISIIYQTPNEAPFSDIIIWSGKDTICYIQEVENPTPFKYRRKVVYKPFRYTVSEQKGYREINDRDTLITLTAKKDFATAVKLSEGQSVLGGAYTTIIFAYKQNGNYHIERYHIPPFFFEPVYRKE